MNKRDIIAKVTITDAEMDKRVKTAVKLAIDRQEAMGVPVARYDRKNGYLYTIDQNGNRQIVRLISDRRRYSERLRDKKKT